MAELSDEERANEVQLLQDLARSLRDFCESPAGEEHKGAIIGFAAQAAGFAGKIQKATTPAAAAALVKEVSKKREKWTELLQMLVVATEVQDADRAVAEAEAKLRATATQLRAVASQGSTGVFGAIGEVAKAAEDGLAEFLAAESYKEKFEVVQKVEEARAKWLLSMDSMRSGILEQEEADNKKREEDKQRLMAASRAQGGDKAAADACVYLEEDGGGAHGDMSAALSAFNACISMPFDMPAIPDMAAAEPAPAPPAREVVTADAAREKLVALLLDEQDGLLAQLSAGATAVQEDESFEACHADAATLSEQLAIAARVVDDSLDDKASGEAKVAVTRACANAKKVAFNLQKYDLYVVKGDMPKLGKKHLGFLNCARAAVDLCDLLKQEAQGHMDGEKAALFLNELDASLLSGISQAGAAASDAAPAASNDVIV